MATTPTNGIQATCRPPRPDRRSRHRLLVRERRSGFDRRRDVCRSPLGAAVEAPLLRLRDDPLAVAEILILINLLSVLDLTLTFLLLGWGAREANPLMSLLLQVGPVQMTLVKLVMVISATFGLWLLRRYRAALATALILVLLYGGLVAYELAGLAWLLL